MSRITPIQRAILELLQDGLPHTREDLTRCNDDPLAEFNSIYWHLAKLRKILRPKGQDIICQLLNKRPMYRWIRLISSGE